MGPESWKPLYAAKAGQPHLLDVPPRACLTIDGEGSPESPEFQEAIQALYSLAYGTKFLLKKRSPELAFKVMPLEGLWPTGEGGGPLSSEKEQWRWALLIPVPGFVEQHVAEAKEQAKAKRDLPALDLVRFETFDEGRCAQVLHIGPYSEEAATIELLHRFIDQAGLKPSGRHHEIYMGDPRRAAPEKLKTILRQPVE